MSEENTVNDNVPGTVLITGAAKRIGRAIALDLAQHGWNIAVHFNSSQAEAEEVAGEIAAHGVAVDIFKADLADEQACEQLVPAINGKMGPLSCLINNASVFEHDTPETATRQSWDRHMQINLRAPFVLTQGFRAQLPETREGNVINIIDQRVWNLTPVFTSYTLSKSGLWALTRTLAQGLAPHIRVNAIGPGPTIKNTFQSQENFDREWQSVLLGRKVDLREICEAIRFILDARSMTGQMIALDSGQHLGWTSSDGLSPASDNETQETDEEVRP